MRDRGLGMILHDVYHETAKDSCSEWRLELAETGSEYLVDTARRIGKFQVVLLLCFSGRRACLMWLGVQLLSGVVGVVGRPFKQSKINLTNFPNKYTAPF